MKKLYYEKDPEKIIWIDAYCNPDHRNVIAWSLIAFGLMEFNRSYVMRNLDFLKTVVQASELGVITKRQLSTFIEPYIVSKLTDDFRMIVFFENFMKAQLLFKGAMIHQFKFKGDEVKLKKFRKAQGKNPLGVETIELNSLTEENIDRQTIGMKLLLCPPYQQVIELPKRILEHVRKVNATRNRLHLLPTLEFSTGPSILEELLEVKSFKEKWTSQFGSAQWAAQILQPSLKGELFTTSY